MSLNDWTDISSTTTTRGRYRFQSFELKTSVSKPSVSTDRKSITCPLGNHSSRTLESGRVFIFWVRKTLCELFSTIALEKVFSAGDRKSTRLNSSHQLISYA